MWSCPSTLPTQMKALVAALFTILFLSSFASAESEVVSILREFYNATNGPKWTHNYGWSNTSDDADPCADNWYGVKCLGGMIYHLHMHNNNLKGRLPRRLGDLKSLWTLDLSYNFLQGEIPIEVARMQITMVSFMSNQFNGTLPVEFCTNTATCVAAANALLKCPKGNCNRNHCLMEDCNCDNTCMYDSDCRGLCKKCKKIGALSYCT